MVSTEVGSCYLSLVWRGVVEQYEGTPGLENTSDGTGYLQVREDGDSGVLEASDKSF